MHAILAVLLVARCALAGAWADAPSGAMRTAVALTGEILVSTNGGVNWTTTTFLAEFVDASMSASGLYQIAVAQSSSVDPNVVGRVFLSNTSGVSWTDITSQVLGQTQERFSGCAMSASGQIITVIGNGNPDQAGGFIYVSHDFGASWSARTTTAPQNDWWAVSMSSSGQYQTAVADSGPPPARFKDIATVYISCDFGNTWTQATDAPMGNWWAVSVASQGKLQAAAIGYGNGHIYLSADYGQTWDEATFSPNVVWSRVRMAANASLIVATTTTTGDNGDGAYLSADSGLSWTPIAALQNKALTGLAVSASGQHIAVAEADAGGAIYQSHDYGRSWMAYAPPGQALLTGIAMN